eukprot:GFUD01132635.1.p1 GENE.GFUD01132635.1~~GFUD01132635.1.p1  ORF type:complete len:348 (-),score=95.97 GFUD01132635.1:24-1067(-)
MDLSALTCLSKDDRQAKEISREIDKQLKRDKQNDAHKLLLLGTGEAGKSTFVKQMKILYGIGFSEEEKRSFRVDVLSNLIDGIKVLIAGMDTLGISYEKDCSFHAWVPQILNYVHPPLSDRLDTTIAQFIALLWADLGIQECFARRSLFQLPDSAKFFLDNIARVTAEEYTPTDEDILLSRKQTIGIIEYQFPLGTESNFSFKLVDVGGQRGERRKWVHVFESVTAIIFLVAVSEYDQVLAEDGKTNRLTEAKRLFRQIISNEWFKDTNIILFLNKKDIFEEKIQTVDIVDFFPEYRGPKADAGAALSFIKEMFEKVMKTFIYLFDKRDTSPPHLLTSWLKSKRDGE